MKGLFDPTIRIYETGFFLKSGHEIVDKQDHTELSVKARDKASSGRR
jgi:hypothetical protein